ncbi:MAG TPA: NAD(P)-dependent oxidoreductase [Gemmatimonadaceae bacterium]|nr:NAD(P)-dependent oxidoreductase [Gemmatimonadaceae bacterium]
MRVAFLGLGAIGAPMAEHLAKAPFKLTVWNRSGEKARAFALKHRVTAAATPQDAVRDAEVIVTCLPSSREVKEVIMRDDVVAAISHGATHVDCTSGDPATSRQIARSLDQHGIQFIDAPVSGGVKGAVAGNLTIMCGGSEADIQRVRAVLSAFGEKIVRCGEIGTGDAVKAMNQALLAIHIWSAGEALAALAKLGVDASVALDVINGSSGRSNSSQNLFPERVLGRAFPRTFKLALLDKDVAIAAGVASDAGVEAPFIELAANLFADAHQLLGEEADHVEAVKVIESKAGVVIG